MEVLGPDPAAASLGLLILLLLVGSCAQWLVWIQHWRNGRDPLTIQTRETIRNSAPQHVPRLPLLLACLWLLIRVPLAMAPQAQYSAERVRVALDSSITEGMVVLVLFLAAYLYEQLVRPPVKEYGLRLNGLRSQLATAGQGFLAVFAPVALMLLITFPLRGEETTHPLLRLLKEDPSLATRSKVLFIAGVMAPLNEELIFRVTFLSALLKYLNPAPAIISVALVFVAIHGLPDALALVPLSLVLCYMFYRERSYLTVVIIHALFNILNVALMLAGLELAE